MSSPAARRAVVLACTLALAAMVSEPVPAARSTVLLTERTSTPVPMSNEVPASALKAPAVLARPASRSMAPLACSSTCPCTVNSEARFRLWLVRVPRSSTSTPGDCIAPIALKAAAVPTPAVETDTGLLTARPPSCKESTSRR